MSDDTDDDVPLSAQLILKVAFRYCFGGLSVSSSIALDGLRSAELVRSPGSGIALSVDPGSPPMPDEHLFTWPGRYGLKLEKAGDQWLMSSSFDGTFLIARDATTIRAFCNGTAPRQDFMDVLVRRILPRLTILHGATVIHAAALSGPDGGILLLGPSGAGKSTLSAALAHLFGWNILSDDMSVMWNDGAAVIAPAATGVCVWPQSREALALDRQLCSEMPGYGGKLRFDRSGSQPIEPVPLRALIFLCRSSNCSAPTLDRLPSAQGLMGAIPQLIRFNPAAEPSDERAAHVDRLNGIMRTVPSYRLTYPDSFASLPAVADALRGLAGQ